MHDERAGLPSASRLHRIVLCPASVAAEEGKADHAPSAVATAGTRIHERLAGQEIDLSPDEEETYTICRDLEVDLVMDKFDSLNIETVREKRQWLYKGMIPVMSGQADAVHIEDGIGLVIDYKTGRGDVADAKENWQLRALACMAARDYNLDIVHVAIIQPWVSPQVTQCTYQAADLERSTGLILKSLEVAEQPDAPFNAGVDQCKYCKAKASCPEAQKSMDLTVVEPAELSSDQVVELLDRAMLAEQVIKSVREHAKKILEDDPTALGQWSLGKGRQTEKIIDPQELFSRLEASQGVSVDQFMSTVSIGKGALKSLLREVSGLKGKNLDELVETQLDGITKTSVSQPPLVKKK